MGDERMNLTKGSYILLIEVAKPIKIKIGAPGELYFDKGHMHTLALR